MNALKFVALALIAAGALSLAYGGFSYNKDETVVKLGSLEISAQEKKRVNVPVWAGIAAIAIGALVLVSGNRKG
jgi:hypothetical protein